MHFWITGFAFSSTASSKQEENAFSFLNSKPAENAFSFLNSKPAVDGSAATNGFAATNSSVATNSFDAKEIKPSFGFVFGSSSNKPVDNSGAKPFGGFVFGKPKSDDDTKKEDVKEVENGVVNGGEKEKNESHDDKDLSKFMKTGSNWTCQTCMVSNPQDKNACVCCETKKPVSASSADQATKKVNDFQISTMLINSLYTYVIISYMFSGPLSI